MAIATWTSRKFGCSATRTNMKGSPREAQRICGRCGGKMARPCTLFQTEPAHKISGFRQRELQNNLQNLRKEGWYGPLFRVMASRSYLRKISRCGSMISGRELRLLSISILLDPPL